MYHQVNDTMCLLLVFNSELDPQLLVEAGSETSTTAISYLQASPSWASFYHLHAVASSHKYTHYISPFS